MGWTKPITDPSLLAGKRITSEDLRTLISDNIEWLRHRNTTHYRYIESNATLLGTSESTIGIFSINSTGGFVLIEGHMDFNPSFAGALMEVIIYKGATELYRTLTDSITGNGVSGAGAMRLPIAFYYIDDDIPESGGLQTYTIKAKSGNNAYVLGAAGSLTLSEVGRGAVRGT